MKLYIRQKVFSWVERFAVWDENGDARYYAEGEFFSWGKKLHVYDVMGNEMAFIQQKVLSLLPRFFVFEGENQVAEIEKEFTFLHPRYRIHGPGWQVEGSIMAHDYQILQGGMPVVAIHKVWMSWADCYELDIADNTDEVMALAVVLAIDCVLQMEATAGAAASAGN